MILDGSGALIPTERQQLIVNRLMTRAGLLRELQDAAGNNRDINAACGYPTHIGRGDYQEMYDRGGMSGRVVDLWPDESWQIYPEVYDDDDEEAETEFEKAWADLCDKRMIGHYLHRIDTLSGIGQYGILLLGLDDGANLRDPVKGIEAAGPRAGEPSAAPGKAQLMYLRAYPQNLVDVASFDADRTSPRYGLPVLYNVTLNDPTAAVGNTGGAGYSTTLETVHWTRVIHVCDNRQSSEVFGTPRMQPVWDNLLNLRRIYGGSAEMLWQGGFPGLSIEMDPRVLEANGGVMFGPEEKAVFEAQIQRYTAGLNRYLLMQGFSVKSLTPNVADPTAHVDINLQAIAMRLGIPLRMLMGSEEAKLASTEDKDTWKGRVRHRQQKYLEPMVLLPFVQRLIALGCLPKPLDDKPKVSWPDVAAPSDADKAKTALTKTQAIAAYVSSNAESFMPPLEYFTIVWGMPQAEAKQLVEAASQHVVASTEADIALSQQYADAGMNPDGTPIPPPPVIAPGLPGAKPGKLGTPPAKPGTPPKPGAKAAKALPAPGAKPIPAGGASGKKAKPKPAPRAKTV